MKGAADPPSNQSLVINWGCISQSSGSATAPMVRHSMAAACGVTLEATCIELERDASRVIEFV